MRHGMTRNTTILVPEGFGQLWRRAASILGEAGYSVLEAADAYAALDIVHRGAPVALLLADAVLLERLDAPALLREAAWRRPELSVLLTSRSIGQRTRRQAEAVHIYSSPSPTARTSSSTLSRQPPVMPSATAASVAVKHRGAEDASRNRRRSGPRRPHRVSGTWRGCLQREVLVSVTRLASMLPHFRTAQPFRSRRSGGDRGLCIGRPPVG